MSTDPSTPKGAPLLDRLRSWVEANRVPLTIFLLNRVALFVLAYLALALMPPGKRPWRAYPDNLFLDGWLRWDSEWYLRIAMEGYTNVAQTGWQLGQRDTAFLPLYPLLARWVGVLVGDPLIGGLVVANVAFLAALVLLYRLVSTLRDPATAERTLVLLAVYPFSFFFGAMYTESLFLLCAVGAFYLGERKRWAWAGLAAAAAGATRIVGLAVTVGLACLYVERAAEAKERVRADILWVLLGLLGPVSYAVFLGMRFGDPLQFIEHQFAGWGRADSKSALEVLAEACSLTTLAGGGYDPMPVVHLATAALAVGVLAACWRHLPRAYVLWAALTMLMSLSLWTGMGRFLAVVFPLFIGAAALLRDDRRFLAVVVVSALFLALFTEMFARFLWVA